METTPDIMPMYTKYTNKSVCVLLQIYVCYKAKVYFRKTLKLLSERCASQKG